MEEYKMILELQLLLIDRDLLKISLGNRTANGFLFEVQSKISTGTYHNYTKLDGSLKDIGWFEILKRQIDNDLIIAYINSLVDYIAESVKQAELRHIGNQVANALAPDPVPPMPDFDLTSIF